jgi:hypothetical protein
LDDGAGALARSLKEQQKREHGHWVDVEVGLGKPQGK